MSLVTHGDVWSIRNQKYLSELSHFGLRFVHAASSLLYDTGCGGEAAPLVSRADLSSSQWLQGVAGSLMVVSGVPSSSRVTSEICLAWPLPVGSGSAAHPSHHPPPCSEHCEAGTGNRVVLHYSSCDLGRGGQAAFRAQSWRGEEALVLGSCALPVPSPGCCSAGWTVSRVSGRGRGSWLEGVTAP